MDNTPIDRFRHLVLQDAGLQAQLWETADRDAFLARVERLGVANGCSFTAEDVRAELRVGRREWREQGEPAVTQVELDRWMPVGVTRRGVDVLVEWCYLGGRPFSEPFFEHTVLACLRHPFNMLFRFYTPIDILFRLQEAQPGLPPAGFIFHMSRCGSTLVSQLLATLPEAIVVSEAEPIDAVLRVRAGEAAVPDEQRCGELRAMVSALGRPRGPQERYLFIKFDSWNVLDLPLIRQAFPTVPWVFVHREPVEVMVSHQRLRGSQMIPGVLPPSLLGLDADDLVGMPLDEYCARMLATICEAAAQYLGPYNGRLVGYRELPDALWTTLLDVFGVAHTPADVERMRHATQFYAKNPAFFFAGDTVDKQQAATTELRRLADEWVQPLYQRLLSLRNVTHSA